MKTVYAYRDNGWMSELTRWQPRRVFCTEQADHSDEPGLEHVVKFRRKDAVATSAAAVISEVLGTQLLAAGGVPTLQPRYVMVTGKMAASYAIKTEIRYTVDEGLHFGSMLLHDVADGPPERFDDLAHPQQLVDLWVFDSWLCTTDRTTFGNILLKPSGTEKYDLIATDQSDCFGGAGRFADRSWRKVLEQDGPGESVEFLQRAIFEAGAVEALERSLEKLNNAADQLDEIIHAVPSAWWKQAGINRNQVKEALVNRRRRMRAILNVDQWESINDDIKGGYLL